MIKLSIDFQVIGIPIKEIGFSIFVLLWLGAIIGISHVAANNPIHTNKSQEATILAALLVIAGFFMIPFVWGSLFLVPS